MIKLNSTGSMRQDGTTFYSYDTPIYKMFNTKVVGIIGVFNNTYYSHTTSKHQSYIRRLVNVNIDLYNLPYGDWDLKTGLHNELAALDRELKELLNKKRLGIRQQERKERIQKLIANYSLIYAELI